MIETLSGKVDSLRPVSKRTVQIELAGIQKLIELTTYEPWVFNRGDLVSISGEVDKKTGKFIGYAYKNQSKGVVGVYEVSLLGAAMFIGIGFFFIWAIFPILHIIAGFRMLSLRNKCKEAFANVQTV